MKIYRAKADQKKYKKSWINIKVVQYIRKNNDKRFYLFKSVLTADAVAHCVHIKPSEASLHSLENGRKYAQDGNIKLQRFLRSTKIHFRKSQSLAGSDIQSMLFPDFLLAVAKKMGLKEARLSSQDKFILHNAKLEVLVY